MIPSIGGGLSNSGQMPISGGHATSGNGDTAFDSRAEFGGLNYNKGINATYLIVAGVIVLGGFLYVKSKS